MVCPLTRYTCKHKTGLGSRLQAKTQMQEESSQGQHGGQVSSAHSDSGIPTDSPLEQDTGGDVPSGEYR